MTRDEAREIAKNIAETLWIFGEDEGATYGVVLAAIVLSSTVAADGRVEGKTFLAWCGIQPSSFRKKAQVRPREALAEFHGIVVV